jgi:Transposase DDE domain
VRSLYNLGGRQATGFIASVFELMGIELPVADHSTVSRRMGRLDITLPTLDATQARHVVVDSTGIKVYEQVSADGAHDTKGAYDTITKRGAKPVIPPRKNAVIELELL